ncbi:streptomycin 6-kinase [Mycolicibacterium duvalii]|uniref:Streptomycin 6-kinase n=1 Tax=Mycolicibacterium duvalii TaxID=39688 RepID=A0A7I7K7H3_9MYCO|nr:streptomycin 6-kinase [Mycolicibacterium duvalii]
MRWHPGGVTALDDVVADWQLRPDGDVHRAGRATVLPVRSDGTPAVLKLGGAEQAHLVLRRWNGDGAARLLRADPHRGALLLERLHRTSLESLPDAAACEVVAGLFRSLHIPALPQLCSLPTVLGDWAGMLASLPNSAPLPRRLVEQAAALCRDLAAEPAESVLHGNLHYGNVLAADREPWLTISPDPVNGDPAYDIAPMLWHRWGDIAGSVRAGVQRRFYALVDAAGHDEDRARAWTIVRIVHRATGVLDDADEVTKLIVLAKAVQD